jgi:L-fuculose-phosphate aldolase
VREALALACRILAREGHESGLAGQVTARGEAPSTCWTLQLAYGFEEATAERMVLVDEDLKPLRGGRPNPGVRFHVWIYRQRPDVNAIIHTHAPYASALAATGQPLGCSRAAPVSRKRPISPFSSSAPRACSCAPWQPEA